MSDQEPAGVAGTAGEELVRPAHWRIQFRRPTWGGGKSFGVAELPYPQGCEAEAGTGAGAGADTYCPQPEPGPPGHFTRSRSRDTFR